jgi:GNAT superfamily N-acetyltransferase
MEIKPCTIAEIFESGLFDEYADESAILPAIDPQQSMYETMAKSGLLVSFGAFDGCMVGFLVMLTTKIPHYNKIIATTESFFVSKNHRSHGTGLKLLRLAEQYAENVGAVGILVSAPAGGRLAEVLRGGLGYRPSNEVFFKCL